MANAEAVAEDATGEERPARRPRRRRGSAAEAPEQTSAPDEVEAVPEDAAVASLTDQDPPAPDAQIEEAPAPSEDGAEDGTGERPRRRSRGSRGGARRRRETASQSEINAALEHSEAAEMPFGQRRESHQRRDAQQSYREPAPRREGAPGAQPQRPREQLRSGSVESLVARQNVLFEEFTQQQAETLREVQRAVRGLGGAQGVSGNILARPKVGIFVDVPNLIYAAEQMGVRVHFGKLLDYLTEGRQLVRATAYAPITDDPQTRFEAQRFVSPVVNNGYKIVTKPWKRFADGSMKANFDIELAVDILTMSDRLDIVVLLSGDGDFRRVCELVESKGVRVEVVAFSQSCAKELREVADLYTDLGGILNLVGG